MTAESQTAAVPSTGNRTETPRKGALWPTRNAELLALVNGPVRLSNVRIAEMMGLREGQIEYGLDKLKAAGVLIVREKWKWGSPPALPATDPLFGVTDDWPEAKILELRALWPHAEIGTAEIGRRLHVTKNAVVGKAHRLCLPSRPSPIIRDPEDRAHASNTGRERARGAPRPPVPLPPRPPNALRSTVVTVEQAGHDPAAPPAVVWVTAEYASGRVIVPPIAGPTPQSRPSPAPGPAAPPPPPRYGRVTECAWPIGHPGVRAFHFCDAPTEPGRPYCTEHVKVAYVRERGHAAPLAGTGALLSGAGS